MGSVEPTMLFMSALVNNQYIIYFFKSYPQCGLSLNPDIESPDWDTLPV